MNFDYSFLCNTTACHDVTLREAQSGKPDEVVVTENEKEDAVIIELKVGPSDMGKVIGRQGRIAKAIRTVVKAASSKSSKKVILDILQ